MVTEKQSFSSSVQKARSGDYEAFDKVFAEQAPELRVYVRYRLWNKIRNLVDTEDLVQEVFLNAFKHFEVFKGDKPRDLFKWLCTIADRRVIDQVRKESRVKRGGAEKIEERFDFSESSAAAGIPDRRPGPNTILALREQGAKMEEAFAKLERRDQDVIALRQFEGLSSKEVAKRMGIKEAYVDVLLFRAMKEWKKAIGSKTS